jgi:alcohol dehydrogenase (cytochrome c)
LFTSTVDGEAIALNQANGERLWSFRMGGSGRGQPIVYEIDGRPYVAVPSGGWAAMGMMTGKYPMAPEGGQLFVFTLDK